MPNKILVAGLTNIEVTLQVESFPIHYSPVLYPFFGVNSAVSGVGFNIAKALTRLGNSVNFLSMVGRDSAQLLVKKALAEANIRSRFVLDGMEQTPHSVVMYDRAGHRQINVDLKDIQDRAYPQVLAEQALQDTSIAVLCNVNFTRPFLDAALRMGKIIATDVHAVSNIEDDYNRDYMAAAHILFMSHEQLPCSPEDWARWLMDRYGTEIIVIGLGVDGALLAVRNHHYMERIPAVFTRPVINTIGAGDALVAAFIDNYNRTRDPYQAIRKAMVFASYKVGATSAADGFLSRPELDQWCLKLAV
ncbi:MAG: carbohydrate kinase family protein [Anaerolineae bacterium]|nr:carbohydrate kinase family protein [Anaerolineae bacterium]